LREGWCADGEKEPLLTVCAATVLEIYFGICSSHETGISMPDETAHAILKSDFPFVEGLSDGHAIFVFLFDFRNAFRRYCSLHA
jgi:hypothetical protein